MQLDDFLAGCKADAGAGIHILRVEALEETENPLVVFRVDADAVIADATDPFLTISMAFDVDFRNGILAVEFDSVS